MRGWGQHGGGAGRGGGRRGPARRAQRQCGDWTPTLASLALVLPTLHPFWSGSAADLGLGDFPEDFLLRLCYVGRTVPLG